jgi:uncharacterized protein with von Willebrand factor type A (vWA) domain
VSTSLIEHDSFDVRAFEEVKLGSARLAQLLERGGKLLPHFDTLLFDLFAALFKLNLVLRPEAETAESTRLGRRLLAGLLAAPDFQKLRDETALDEFRAAMGAATLAEGLLRALRGEDLLDAGALAAMQGLADREEEIRRLREELDAVNELGRSGSATAQDLEHELDLAGDELGELAQENRQIVDDLPPGFETRLEQQVGRLPGDIHRAEEELESWGTGVGAPGHLSPAERLELGERLARNPNLKRLADLVGAMRHFALSARKSRFERAVDEIHTVRQASDLARLLPSELAHLRQPLRRLDFLRRFTEGELLAYDLRGEERRGRGPLLVCLDGSSSMAGDKELWSKAVTLTLLEIARREGRAFRAIYFSSREAPLTTFDLLPRGRRTRPSVGRLVAKLPEVIALCEHFPGGGTDFEKPLEAAMRALEEAALENGDIVLITDGECDVSAGFRERFLAAKRAQKFRLFGVEVDVGSHSRKALRELADRLTSVTRLTNESLKDIFCDI